MSRENGCSSNGTALNDSWNIASVTDHGVGDFTLTFTETQPNANYVTLGAASAPATDGFALILQPRVDTSQRNATSCRWNCVYDNGAGTRTLADATWMDVIFFGDP